MEIFYKRSNTSLLSPFWLTEKLGRTSTRVLSLGLGENETQKLPSPSAYPERYMPMF